MKRVFGLFLNVDIIMILIMNICIVFKLSYSSSNLWSAPLIFGAEQNVARHVSCVFWKFTPRISLPTWTRSISLHHWSEYRGKWWENSPEEWLHNKISYPSNRSKQILETHRAYSAGTQYTRQSLNEKTHTHKLLSVNLIMYTVCRRSGDNMLISAIFSMLSITKSSVVVLINILIPFCFDNVALSYFVRI